MHINNSSWNEINKLLKDKKFDKLKRKIEQSNKANTLLPKYTDIFKAYEILDLKEIKIVILGQDPYPCKNGIDKPDGLSFSQSKFNKVKNALKNIFKELENDLSIKRINPDLSDWSEQGIFLLNTILTVEIGKPKSHSNLGWEIITDETIKLINDNCNEVVFVLWGNDAKVKKDLINQKKHHIIEGVHPSPLSASRGFYGSKPFSKINKIHNIKW